MSNVYKKRTVTCRVDPEFKKFIDDLSRFKANQEKEEIKPSRITQAIFNQYKKYPNLLEEMKISKLGKWKSK